MKKVFIGIFSVMISLGAWAQSNELGIIAGGMNGVSYKKIMSETFAIQTDLTVGFQRTVVGDAYIDASGDFLDFTLNPNFLYNKTLDGKLYAFAGGGASMGLAHVLQNPTPVFGKFGVNAMMGFGYKFTNTPLSIALDFRPGYAMLLNIGWEALFHSFDWHLGLSARYCF